MLCRVLWSLGEDEGLPFQVSGYLNTMFKESSFQETKYPEEVVIWGWNTAREKVAKNEEVTCAV